MPNFWMRPNQGSWLANRWNSRLMIYQSINLGSQGLIDKPLQLEQKILAILFSKGSGTLVRISRLSFDILSLLDSLWPAKTRDREH